MSNLKDFKTELTQLFNRHGIDNLLGIPDFILATLFLAHFGEIQTAWRNVNNWVGAETRKNVSSLKQIETDDLIGLTRYHARILLSERYTIRTISTKPFFAMMTEPNIVKLYGGVDERIKYFESVDEFLDSSWFCELNWFQYSKEN